MNLCTLVRFKLPYSQLQRPLLLQHHTNTIIRKQNPPDFFPLWTPSRPNWYWISFFPFIYYQWLHKPWEPNILAHLPPSQRNKTVSDKCVKHRNIDRHGDATGWYYPTDGAQTRKKINTFHDAFHTKCSLPIFNVIQKLILNNIVLP